MSDDLVHVRYMVDELSTRIGFLIAAIEATTTIREVTERA